MTSNQDAQDKVQIIPFEGIAPQKYALFFLSSDKRKDGNGQALKQVPHELSQIDAHYIDPYVNMELKITEHLETWLKSANIHSI